MPRENNLRVWWINNVIKRFFVYVDTIEEAKVVLNVLSAYDLKLGEYIEWNTGGLEIYEPDIENEGKFTWYEWRNEYGDDIMDLMNNEGE